MVDNVFDDKIYDKKEVKQQNIILRRTRHQNGHRKTGDLSTSEADSHRLNSQLQ